MTAAPGPDPLRTLVEQALARASAALRAASVPTEALAELVPARRRMLIRLAPTMRPLGEVWRVGSLLISADRPGWFTGGTATRAAERGRPGYQSVSREERREIAAAALRGGYPVGTPVSFDAVPLPLDGDGLRALGPDAPVGVLSIGGGADGHPAEDVRVRWRAGAELSTAPTLDAFLTERVRLISEREGA
ncbi:hypothetical protein AB3K78_00640 [Leucobacter sp. HNU]|uniref:hypothetical protein n=1 Tax=Leucobacter sp. HNU TaxID=3236805 RepID=UPI003A80B68F